MRMLNAVSLSLSLLSCQCLTAVITITAQDKNIEDVRDARQPTTILHFFSLKDRKHAHQSIMITAQDKNTRRRCSARRWSGLWSA
jgi:hypothetical protein